METNLPANPSKTNSSRRERVAQAQKQSREVVLMVLLPVMFSLGLGLGWILWGSNSSNAGQQTRYEVSADDDPFIGPADAPITLVEFSDYQCPYCTRWYAEVFPRLMKEYEGKIRFVYRDLPLASIHPEAIPAANAANCAGEQQAYFQYHDALFNAKYGLGQSAYIQYATELGLNVEAFTTCLNENRYADEIDADIRDGYAVGASSTPTFYINGIPVVGAQPYEVFRQIIDKELAGENQ